MAHLPAVADMEQPDRAAGAAALCRRAGKPTGGQGSADPRGDHPADRCAGRRSRQGQDPAPVCRGGLSAGKGGHRVRKDPRQLHATAGAARFPGAGRCADAGYHGGYAQGTSGRAAGALCLCQQGEGVRGAARDVQGGSDGRHAGREPHGQGAAPEAVKGCRALCGAQGLYRRGNAVHPALPEGRAAQVAGVRSAADRHRLPPRRGLQWRAVDLDAGTITIERNLQYTAERGVYETMPKNGKVRVVDISPDVAELLRALRRTQPVTVRWVFTQDDSAEPMHPDTPTRYFQRFGKRFGIEHFHPHKLRHTSASIAITNGADVVSVAARLGHSDSSTTLRMYAHANEESIRRVGQTVRDALREPAQKKA